MRKLKLNIDWISLAVVCNLNVHFFYILGRNMGVESGAGSIAFLASLICLFAAFARRTELDIKKYPYLLLFNIVLFPVVSIMYLDYSEMSVIKLIAFSALPMLLFLFKFNPKKVIEYTCYFIPLALLVQNDLFRLHGSFDQMEMGYSYAVVHFCVASLFELFYYRKEIKKNYYMMFCIAVGIYLTLKLILLSTRGTLVSILAAVFLICITNLDNEGNIKKPNYRIVFVGILAFAVIYNYKAILNYLIDVIPKVGIRVPAAFQKTFDALKNKDLSHGRDELNVFVEQSFRQRPWFGYGTQTFKYFQGHYAYPHNCMMQLLFENGIVGSFYILINLFTGIYFAINPRCRQNKDEVLAKRLIMLAAIPMLFFSNDMWTTPAFWMFLIICCRGRNRGVF